MKHYNKTDLVLVDLVISQTPRSSYAAIALAVLVGIVLWPVFGAAKVGLWLTVGIISGTLRGVIFSRMHDGKFLADNYLWRELVTAIDLMIAGVYWGMLAWLFLDPSNTDVYTFVVGAILGVVAAMLAIASPRPNLWLVFAASEFFVVIWKLISLGNIPMAIMSVVFLISLFFVTKAVGERIETSVTKDFQNAELLEAVSKAKELAEQANIEKSRFMAATSHDLRQPLHAQGLLIETLKGQQLEDASTGLLEKLTQSNEALNTLFNSLLEISQLDAGTIRVSRSHQSVRSICQQIVGEFEHQAADKNLSINLTDSDYVVFTDPILLSRMIRNLVGNALKYTQHGQVNIELEFQKGVVELLVRDTGIGIATEEQENIFDEYTQLNNDARDRQQGVGLGLALVRRMCTLLQHDISVESALGNGSCFKLILPLGDDLKVIAPEPDTPNMHVESVDIVLVDDEQTILDAMEVLLKQWGCRCHAYASIERAEQALQAGIITVDIIISDYRLGGDLNGLQCIERLRQVIGENTPAVLLSGDTDPVLLNQVQAAGFYMLHKPLKPAKLRNAMAILLDSNTLV